MFCGNCGKEVEDNEVVCPFCGVNMKPARPAPRAAAPVEPVQEEVVEEYVQPEEEYVQPEEEIASEEVVEETPEYVEQPVVAPANDNPAKIFGILGFVFSFFVGIVGIILSAIGLKKYKKQEQ